MVGRRKELDENGNLNLAEGEYGKGRDGVWYARAPGSHMGNLGGHDVEEHEDGTITVTPSILIRTTKASGEEFVAFHGYLRRGVWSTT